MTITLERGTWYPVKATFSWYDPIDYNCSQKIHVFYASEKSPNSHYKEAVELSKYLSDFLEFNFYIEEGVKKVLFHPKKDCNIIIK